MPAEESLRQMLLRHEGIRLRPYTDTVGKLTIGVGRNLTDVGITFDESMNMLDLDILRVENDCIHAFPWFVDLTETRKNVLLNMCFNMGIVRLTKFKTMLAAVEAGNYDAAAVAMLDSLWAKQVGRRALDLANLMRGSAEV